LTSVALFRRAFASSAIFVLNSGVARFCTGVVNGIFMGIQPHPQGALAVAACVGTPVTGAGGAGTVSAICCKGIGCSVSDMSPAYWFRKIWMAKRSKGEGDRYRLKGKVGGTKGAGIMHGPTASR
jgi:hypothetical protein